MAADAVGLLDHLDVPAAHMVGASMGGMIAQTIAIEHPERVLTLTSIMSTTGERTVGQPTDEALQRLLVRPTGDRAEIITYSVETSRVIGSPELFDEERIRARAETSYDRCVLPGRHRPAAHRDHGVGRPGRGTARTSTSRPSSSMATRTRSSPRAAAIGRPSSYPAPSSS